MFTAFREWYKYGHEWDPTELTVKEFDSLDNAIAYIYRYAKGIRFCSAWVEDENGKVLYEILNGGANTYDHREGA